MSIIAERQNKVVSEFDSHQKWEEKYKHIINLGKKLSPLDEQYMIDDLKVKGCQSQVWLHASLSDNNTLVLQADSDALIVKGLVSLLVRIYSNADLDEIMTAKLFFIEKIGLQSHLSPSRANGLQAMIKQIKLYAYAYKVKLSS